MSSSCADRNVEVLNETADLYRFFDCTDNAEFLYGCVEQTVDQDLPQEIDYLKRHDEAMRRTMKLVEMPDRMAEDMLMFIGKNNGKLGNNRREGQFAKLADEEVAAIEAIVQEAFIRGDELGGGPLTATAGRSWSNDHC